MKILLKKILKNNTIKNGMWLYVLQMFNTVIPFLTLPYITRILGADQYGVFSAALNLIGYFQVIVEYGFNLLGSRKVALLNKKEEMSELYTKIFLARLILSAISLSLLVIVVLLTGVSQLQFYCMLILFFMVIGTGIQQVWLFQGLESMKFITVLTVIIRTIFTILIFILIKNSSQVLMYSFLYSISFFLLGLISMFIANNNLNIKFVKIKASSVYDILKEGWILFTTSAMTKIFTGIGITILQYTSTNAIVGSYTAIQKIPQMLVMLFFPLSQAIYPYLSKIFQNSFEEGLFKLKRITKSVMLLFICMGLVLILFRRPIVLLLYGSEYIKYVNILIPLVLWLLFSIFNNFLGTQFLVATGNVRRYSNAFKIGIVAMVSSNLILGYFFDIYGIAFAAMLGEFILTISLWKQVNEVIMLKGDFHEKN
ncbi:oligosaccharide flippase family protein [Vagococcus sp. PNs007]|uniref:Oligosaccharide flippase family protein n=1 Tax=Vagococcus proximus TaxID=2991417 RepID=A0ABT5X006_9ENTE|nr:oligosaccharide flippase family protein [Vagococcus proximus]MDF0479343.1 oligosaccharide flippase family protein [Vagococcus proximus]